MASVPFVARHTTFDPVLRLLFLRRLWLLTLFQPCLPVWPSTRFHHHRTACAVGFTSTVRSSKPLAGGKNVITLSSLANKVARASLSLLRKWEADGFGVVSGVRQGQSASRA